MNNCPQCGREVGADAVRGLCPECLLRAGFGTVSETAPDGRGFAPPPVADLAPLFPQLEILELVGRGGMGAVYRARQKDLDRFVALKILPPGIGQDPAFADRFAREAKALARLNHPNVVTLYEFGSVQSTVPVPSPVPRPPPLFFFLMEYVDGVNLRQLLAGGRVSPREALAIVPQICDALQYAHDQGVVHRDIKPENILLDRRGRVKVADFGLAKIVRSPGCPSPASGPVPAETVSGLSHAGHIMGTPPYMAPEQRENPAEVDHRADIYSLGVVFYQMLTGELPGRTLEPPSRKVSVDVRLDEVVLRALEAKPERRYQQVGDVKTICETIATQPLNGESAAVPPLPDSVPGGRWVYAVPAGLYIALLVLLARTASELPARVATHFGFEGAANGWMERSAYLAFTAVVPLLLGLLFAGLSSLFRVIPARFVNLPNRDYWLAPERRDATAVRLRAWLAGLLGLFVFFFGGLHLLTVAANHVTPPRLPMGGLLVVVMAFLIGLMLWTILLLMRFAETRDRAIPPPHVHPRSDSPAAASDRGNSAVGRRETGPIWWVAAVHAGGLLTVFGLLAFMGPKFEVVLNDFGASLPRTTQAILEFSRFVRLNGFWLLPPVVAAAGAASWLMGWAADRVGGRKLLAVWAVLGLIALVGAGVGLSLVLMHPIARLAAETGTVAPAPVSAPVHLPIRGLLLTGMMFLAGLVLWRILRFTRPGPASAGLPGSGNSAVGGVQDQEPAVAQSGTEPDATLWAPFQSPRLREVVAHMTSGEKRDGRKRAFFFGLWNAGTFFVPFFLLFFSSLPGPMNWIYAGAVLVLGLSFHPLLHRMHREFLCSTAWAREQGIRPDDLRRGHPDSHGARGRRHRVTRRILLCVAIALALRTWVIRPFSIRNDALSPEIPAGSWVLAWLPVREFRPGDLMVYRDGERYFVGRVSEATADRVQVNRNGVPDFAVARDTIRGRVTTVLWRGASAVSPVSVTGGEAVVRGDGAPGFQLAFRIGGRMVWRAGFVNKAPFAAFLKPSGSGNGLDVRVTDGRGVSLLTLGRSTVGRSSGRLVIRDGGVRVGPDTPAAIGEYTPDGGTPESATLNVEPSPDAASPESATAPGRQ